MVIQLSRCRRCGTGFQPWGLRCPACGRPLPIVGAAVLLGLLSAGVAAAAVGRRLGLW